MHGRATVVEERYLGTTLAADATAGDGTLTVDDATDFDDAGQLQLTSSDGLTTEEISYTAIDEDANTVTLDGTLSNSYTADDGVDVLLFPLSLERWAIIVENDNPEDEEGLWARVPHSLYDKMPVGVRDLDAGEGETVDAGYVGEDLVVNDVTAQQPLVDGTYIDPSTLPPASASDGDPPPDSPTPVVTAAPRALALAWAATVNTDRVTYDVYISTSNGFTPGPTNFVGSTDATFITLYTDAAGALLLADTTYYVKLISSDPDGAAAAGTQASGVPLAEAGTPDGAAPGSSPTPTVTGFWRALLATWAAVSNADPVVYDVYVSASNGFTPGSGNFVGSTEGTSLVIPALHGGALLAIGTTYYVKTIARDADGSAAASSQGSAATLNSDGNVPASSPTPTVRNGAGYLAAYWTPVANNDTVTYDVYVSATNGFTPGATADALTPVLSTLASSAVLKTLVSGTALAYGTTYYVKLIAKDADGSAAAGSQGSGAPTKVTTGEVSSDGSAPGSSPTPTVISGPLCLSIQWAAVANNDPVTYAVYADTSGSGFTPGSGNLIGSTVGLGMVITKLTGGVALATGQTYYVKVIASDADGAAAASSAGSGTVSAIPTSASTTDGNAPGSSPTPVVTPGPRLLAVTWPAVANNDPVSYAVYCSTASGFTPGAGNLIGTTTGLTMVITQLHGSSAALVAGTTYYVKIVASDADGAAAAGSQGSSSVVDSDGSAPGSSPAANAVGGLGNIFVYWTAITNPDSVTYEVHLSTSPTFTPTAGDTTTMVGKTKGTKMTLNTAADGSALAYFVDPTATPLVVQPYYVRIIATDLDGAATPGTVSAQTGPSQVGAGDIIVNSIDVEQLARVLTLDANTIQTADKGQRVVIDNSGVTLFNSNGDSVVVLPTDSGQNATFSGKVISGDITITGNLLMQGLTNFMDKGSQLTLNDQFAASAVAPNLAFEYEAHPESGYAAPDQSNFSPAAGLTGPLTMYGVAGLDYVTNGGTAQGTNCHLMCKEIGKGSGIPTWYTVEVLASDYTVNRFRSTGFDLSSGNVPFGITKVGNDGSGHNVEWVGFTDSSGNVKLKSYRSDDYTIGLIATTTITSGIGSTTQGIGLGTDGTRLLIATWASGSNGALIKIARYSVAAGIPTFVDQFTTSGGQARQTGTTIGGITARDGFYTVTGSLLTGGSSGSDIVWNNQYDQTTKALITGAGGQWHVCLRSAGATVLPDSGISWDGTQYWGLDLTYFVKYTPWTWVPGTGSDNWWIGFTWMAQGVDTAAITSITNANPAVITTTAVHGLNSGDEVYFTVAGGSLPAHIVSGTHYFVQSAGLTTTAFRISATRGGADISTNGDTSSGTFTLNYVRETKTSPLASVKLNGANATIGIGSSSSWYAMRGQVRVVSAPLPAAATDTRVYMLNSTAAPVVTTLTKQAPWAHSVGSTSYTQYINQYAAGTVYRDSTSFTQGTSNIVANASGIQAGWNLGGDGQFRVPRYTAAQRVASPTQGMLQFNDEGKTLEYYDGNSYQPIEAHGYSYGLGFTTLAQRLVKAGLQTNCIIAQAYPLDTTLDTGTVIGTNVRSLTNQRLELHLCWLPAGTVVTKVSLVNIIAGGAITGLFGAVLFSVSNSGVLTLRASATGIGNGIGERGSAFAQAYTVPTSGFYYYGVLINSTNAMPASAGQATTNTIDQTAFGFSTTLPKHIVIGSQTSLSTQDGVNVSTFTSNATNLIWYGLNGRPA